MSAATGIEASRARGARLLAWAIWAHVPVLGLAVWAVGGPAGAVALLAALTAAGVEGALRLSPPAAARLAVAAGLAAQPMLLTAGFAGHAWQVDTHMHFFAVLAMLALMTDLRALLAGAGLIAVHHLGLNFLWPALVYPGGADLGRTLLHAVIVVIETAVLAVMILDRQALDAAGAAARAEAEAEAANARALEAAGRAAEADRNRERAEVDALLRDSVGDMVTRARCGDFSGRIGDGLVRRSGNADMRRAGDGALIAVAGALDALFAETESVLDGMQAHLAGIRQGDFAARSTDRREGRFEQLRLDLNATSAALADLAEGLEAAVTRTGGMADEIDRSAAGAARRAESAAASLEETSATMEQISASVAGTADRLGEAERMAGDISARTGQGAAAAREAVAAVARIESSSTRISEIISVIDAIAFQTNLLALNAAVEAARAGEAGKGFAVVAAEVRGLAQRSSDAARDIAGLIKDGAGHVADGVRLVQAAGGSLDRIAAEVDGLAEAIAQIAAAGREQAQGVTEINAAVADLDGATQANAAEAETASALAARLRAEVATLTELMARLSGTDAGARTSRAA